MSSRPSWSARSRLRSPGALRLPLGCLSLVLTACALPARILAEDPPPLANLAPTVGEYLERDYYDHSRFQPRILVQRALRALDLSEVSIDARWHDQVITVTTGETSQDIPAPEPHGLDDAMQIIERVRTAIDASSFPADRRRDLDYAMVNGALASLDPHTVLMPPEPGKEFREDIAGEFYGIGAFLSEEGGAISIDRVMSGLPAEKAGIEDGDVVLGIDGEKTAGLSLEQAVHRIKGPKGTTVVLTVERKSRPQPIDIPVTRDLVQVITIRSYRSGDIGYVRMDEFNLNAARDLYRAIADLESGGPIKALVLDLRYNGGGLLDQARIISDFFLPPGEEIVRTVTAEDQPVIYKSSARQLVDVPMLVLTSGGSASAAEILSGCLQCNDRAVVIGSTTFGKGSVQTIRDLADGSRLKLTIQEYQLPGGVSIQDVGVTPDVRLIAHEVFKDGSIHLLPYSDEREVDDEFAFKNRHAYDHPSFAELGWVEHYQSKDELKRSTISSRDFVPDQEASLAIDLLKEASAQPDFVAGAAQANLDHTSRQFLLEALKAPIAARAEQESAALGTLLAAAHPPIAWGPATALPAHALRVAYTGPAAVTAGTTVPLTFALTNTTATAIGRIYGVVSADRGSPLWENEVIFGAIPASSTTTGTLTFAVPPRLYAGDERFTLELRQDGQSATVASIPVQISVVAQPRPHFSYTWKIDAPAGDGRLVPGESSAISFTIHNDGQGPSAKIDLLVFKDNDAYVQLGDNHLTLPPLAKDASTTIKVPLAVLPQIKHDDKLEPFSADAIKLQVRIEETFDDGVDGRYRADQFNILTIPVKTPVTPAPVLSPHLSLLGVAHDASDPDTVTLSVAIDDPTLRFVTLFLNEDKVDLEAASALHPAGVYHATVHLKGGGAVNELRVLAVDRSDVEEVLPIRLWGVDPAPAPAAQPPVAGLSSAPPSTPVPAKPAGGAIIP